MVLDLVVLLVGCYICCGWVWVVWGFVVVGRGLCTLGFAFEFCGLGGVVDVDVVIIAGCDEGVLVP